VTAGQLLEAWNQRNPELVAAVYHPEVVALDPFYPEPLRGKDAVQDDAGALLRVFPDAEFELLNLMTKEDMCAYELVLRGTHRAPMTIPTGLLLATNKRIELWIATFLRVDDTGRIVEERRYFDVGSLLVQLGATTGR
jgi:steroid delta-isomerase-like uncharacterized protein